MSFFAVHHNQTNLLDQPYKKSPLSAATSGAFNAPVNGFAQGWGGGGGFEGRATQVNLTFSGFQMSIFSPLGLHYKSYSHPWGPQIVFCY